MVRVVLTAIEVHPQTLFDGNGDVRQWMVGLSAEMKIAVKAMAPPSRSRARYARTGTGALQRSIKAETARTGPLQNVSVVSTSAPHAKYVLGGTAFQGSRYIYSRAGFANKQEIDRLAGRVHRPRPTGRMRRMYLVLPLNGIGGNSRFHLRVHGQRANNFLFDGYNIVARKHRALKVMRNPYAF